MRVSFFLQLTRMASLECFFAPPATVKGMHILDKAAFRREVVVPAIRLQPAQSSEFLKRLQHVVLKYPGVKKFTDVVAIDGSKKKVLLLAPDQLQGKSLTEEDVDWIQANGGEKTTHTIPLEYQHYTMGAILRAVLPAEIKEVPSAFEIVGHIAHLNLRDECLPYKEIIAQVLLDKQSNIRTVVNKTDTIDDTFRFFKMELLAGEDNMIATLKENGCSFSFDFSKVYWNSRLHTEHERLVNMLKKGETVLDVFAGVGPFAIPASKKGCQVHANDLNTHSYTALCENAKENRVTALLKAYNMDGREFIQTVTQKLIGTVLQSSPDQGVVYSHVIMNLPASAVEFLDTFKGIFRTVPENYRCSLKLPLIHCYCFSKSLDPDDDVLKMVERSLGVALREDCHTISTVRQVAPSKVMMRVSFQLPAEVAYSTGHAIIGVSGECNYDNCDKEPSPKRTRLN